MKLTPDPIPTEAPPPRRSWPRRILTIVGLWAIVSLFVYTIVGGGTKGGPETGSDAVMMKVPQLGAAAPYDMASLKGKTVLLDFWATHCGPCKRTLPALQTVYERYKDDPDVVVLSVNVDHAANRDALVSRYIKHFKFTFPVLMDDGPLSSAYKVQFIPLLVAVSPDGKVMQAEVGAHGENVGEITAHLVKTIELARGPSS